MNSDQSEPAVESPLVRRAIDRSIQDRLTTTTGEVERLVSAAIKVVVRNGSMDASLREILKEADLSTPVIYRHFQSKDDLMLIVLDEGARILASYLEQRMAQQETPLAKIRAWIEGFLHQVEEPQTAEMTRPFALGSGELFNRFPDESLLIDNVLIYPLEREIVAANEQEHCQSDDPSGDARCIYDLITSCQRRYFYQHSVPDPEAISHLVQFAFRALRVESSLMASMSSPAMKGDPS